MKDAPSDKAVVLDLTRKLRSYMSSLDAAHLLLTQAKVLSEPDLNDKMTSLQDTIEATNTQVVEFLKLIEQSRVYKDMTRTFNIGDDNGDE